MLKAGAGGKVGRGDGSMASRSSVGPTMPLFLLELPREIRFAALEAGRWVSDKTGIVGGMGQA